MSVHGADAVAVVTRLMALRTEEGELRFEDLFPNFEGDTEALAALWLWWDEYRLAAARVAQVINTELGRRLEGGSVEVAGWRVFGTVRKDEKCVDTAGFHAWLRSEVADNPDLVERLFNPDTVRKGQLPPSVRDTFFEKVERHGAKREVVAAPVDQIEKAAVKRELTEQAVKAKEESDGR